MTKMGTRLKGYGHNLLELIWNLLGTRVKGFGHNPLELIWNHASSMLFFAFLRTLQVFVQRNY
jgi:hypothetical protein